MPRYFIVSTDSYRVFVEQRECPAIVFTVMTAASFNWCMFQLMPLGAVEAIDEQSAPLSLPYGSAKYMYTCHAPVYSEYRDEWKVEMDTRRLMVIGAYRRCLLLLPASRQQTVAGREQMVYATPPPQARQRAISRGCHDVIAMLRQQSIITIEMMKAR